MAAQGQIEFDFESMEIGERHIDDALTIDDVPAIIAGETELYFENEDGGEGMDEKDRASLTELLAADLDDQPVPSRRARKASGSERPVSKVEQPELLTGEDDHMVIGDIWESDLPVDEPTLEFRPLRQPEGQPKRRAVEVDEEPANAIPVRSRRERVKPEPDRRKPERRIYSDDDYDYDDEYDGDDYDDDYDDDEDDSVGIGHYILGFFKGIILIGLILLLIVLGLRQMESSGILSLNWLRDLVGGVVPIENVFPEPQAQPQLPEATPEADGQPATDQPPQEQPAEQPAQAAPEQPLEQAQPPAEQQPAEQQPAA